MVIVLHPDQVVQNNLDLISCFSPDREDKGKTLEPVVIIIINGFGGAGGVALQAGREVRIFVMPEEVDDLASLQLARDIARKIEETMAYPGQIKVTVIRETRAVEFAK